MTEKSVNVFLTPQDEAALAKPRRRRTRKVGGAEESTMAPTGATATTATTVANTTATLSATTTATTTVSETPLPPTPTPATTTTATTTPTTPTTTPTTAPTTETTSAPATTPTTGGVHIKTRKRTHGSLLPPTPVPSKSTARILPIKRHAMPSKEKPKLHIPVGGQAQNCELQHSRNHAMSGSSASLAIASHSQHPVRLGEQDVLRYVATRKSGQAQPQQPQSQTVPQSQPQVPQPQQKAGKKRRFTERRIGISVKSLKTTRKARKSIRKQVAAMSVSEIRKVLTEKGVLKGKTNPPETMLRSLMKDYLSLKH